MTILSTLVNDPAPPIILLDTAPIAAPAPGTQLVTSLQWNNLLDLLRGTSVDEIDRDALEVMTINRAAVSDATGHLDVSVTTLAELALLTGLTENVQTSLNAKELSANKGAVSGYAALDASQLLLLANFPAGTGSQILRRNPGNTALEFFTLTQTLEALTDTTITAAAANESLVRNAGNTAWINALIANANVAPGRFANITGLSGAVNFLTDNTAAVIEIEKNSTTPSVAIIGQIDWIDDNSVGARTVYAREESWIVDPTNGSEDGLWQVSTMIGGTLLTAIGVNLAIDGEIDLFRGVDLNNQTMQKIGELLFAGLSINLTHESGTHLMTNNDFRIHKTNSTAVLEIEGDHTTPASQIIGEIQWFDDNSIGSRIEYASIQTAIVSPTSGSEESTMKFVVRDSLGVSNYILMNSGGSDQIGFLKDLNMFSKNIIDINNINFDTGESITANATFMDLNVGVGDFVRILQNGTPLISIGSTNPIINLDASEIHMAKGSDVASTASLVIPVNGNSHDITGTTNIATISINNRQEGAVLYLQFDGVLTITHGTGTNQVTFADGVNYTTAAGDILTLIKDGVRWREISRSRVAAGGGATSFIAFNADADLQMDGFDIFWNGTGAAPATGTNVVTVFDDGGVDRMVLGLANNTSTFQLKVNAALEYEFKNNTLNLFGNGLTNPGNFLDVNNNELLRWITVASATNFLSISNSATGTDPILTANLSQDANAGIRIEGKTKGSILFTSQASKHTLELIQNAGNGVNYLQLTNAITAEGPILESVGTDANVDFNIQTKGTGTINLLDSIVLADAVDIALNATTGTKIATATTQKLGFWNATPIVQPTHIADATGGATIDAEARTAINAVLAQLAALGLQAAA